MPTFKQPTFTGGEIAPEMYGRSDFAKYYTAVRRCRNFIPTAQGALVNRPGSYYQSDGNNSAGDVFTGATAPDRRVIPFIFSTDQSYTVMLGHLHLRVLYHGAQLSNIFIGPSSTATTPWTAAQIWRVKFSQSGNDLYLCHPDQVGPQVLTRTAHTTWAFTPWSPSTYLLTGPVGQAVPIWYTNAATDKSWSWVITAVHVITGETYPSAAVTKACTLGNGQPDTRVTWTAFTGAIAYNVYRGRNGQYGFVGQSKTTSFYDDGQEPDYAIRPPAGENPFSSTNNYPAVPAFYEQRLVLANTNREPQSVRTTRTGNYLDIDEPALVTKDDDPVTFTIASLRREEIRSLLPQFKLLAFTRGAVWSLGGSADQALSPSSIEARPRSFGGSSWLDPIAVGKSVLYVQELGNAVRDLVFEESGTVVGGADLSVIARHLLLGHTIVDWAYQSVPYGVVWAVRDDGVLLSLTYQREHEVFAWAWHDSPNAVYESVCVVPEGSVETVYAVVRRLENNVYTRYFEKFASRDVTDVRTGVFLDQSRYVNGTNTGSKTLVLTSLSGATAGSTATLVASSATFHQSIGTGVAWEVGQEAHLLASTATPIRVVVRSYTDSTHLAVELVEALPSPYTAGSPPAATTDWAEAPKSLWWRSGISGITVSALADGNAVGSFVTNVDGVITLPTPAVRIVVGLAYAPEIETLDLASQGQEIRTANKNVHCVSFEVYGSRGIWAGEDFDHLSQWIQRTPSAGYAAIPPESALVEVKSLSSWNKGGRAVLRQVDPLPVTVLSVLREVEIGRP